MDAHQGEHWHYTWKNAQGDTQHSTDESKAYYGGRDSGNGFLSELISASSTCYGFGDKESPIEVIARRQDLNQEQLPRTLLGCNVVMAIMMPDVGGLLPRRHVVTLEDEDKDWSRAFSTHYVAYQPDWNGRDGRWVLHFGHYDMQREKAIKDMITRERYER
jgi:hypothetical protein